MKDEKRLCARCKHEHDYGILRYSADNVPLYGARRCEFIVRDYQRTGGKDYCGCSSFVETVPGMENLPALSDGEVKTLWEQTSFLNAQVPMATRIMVRSVLSAGEKKKGIAAITAQWPEFVGLMISQLTDIRGAMVRDESKFAHLVAHTDEILEGMKGAVQLAERLTGMNQRIDDTNERLDRIEKLLGQILKQADGEAIPAEELAEHRRIFGVGNNAPLRDEAIVTDGRPVDPDKTE